MNNFYTDNPFADFEKSKRDGSAIKEYRERVREIAESDAMTKSITAAKKLYSVQMEKVEAGGKVNLAEKMKELYESAADIWLELILYFDRLKNSKGKRKNVDWRSLGGEDNKKDTKERIVKFMKFSRKASGKLLSIYMGEGRAMTEAEKKIKPKMPVKLVCGPVMVKGSTKKWDEPVNELVYYLVKHHSVERSDVTILVNMTSTLLPCFGGYFHSFMRGDYIFFEAPHRLGEKSTCGFCLKFGNDSEGDNLKKAVAKHFKKYEDTLTYELECDKDVEKAAYQFCTYSEEGFEELFTKDEKSLEYIILNNQGA